MGVTYRGMSKVQFYCWMCDHEGCGHVWLKMSDKVPERCAKCRRRGWHRVVDEGQEEAAPKGVDLKVDRETVYDEDVEAMMGEVENG
jgi:predicted  nucleic acid-binding Zn-ribbon protein